MGEGRSDLVGRSDQTQDGGNPVPASGRRPQGQDQGTKSFEAKQRSDFDPKGNKRFGGYAPGQNFRKKTSAEMVGEVRQASQEAPEAIEQQRIPRPAQGIAKGYFRGLGGTTDQPPKKEAAPK